MFSQKFFLIYIFYITLSVFIFYIKGLSGVLTFYLSFFFYAGMIYIIVYFWNSLLRKKPSTFSHFFRVFCWRACYGLSLFFLLFGSFIITQNELLPAKLPVYTLSNGETTVVFQTMSHIGSPSFYSQVQTSISSAKKQGFVLFYEGVRAGKSENHDAFNAALGITFDENTYIAFSKLYGVVAQDNTLFLGLENTKDYNVDLTIDEVMDLYREKVPQQKESPGENTTELHHTSDILLEVLEGLSYRQLQILQYSNQALLNFLIKHEAVRNSIIQLVGNPDILTVILDERNQHLVGEIQKSTEKKIFILYGLMHFEGVLELLQTQDPRWKVIEIQWRQLIVDSKVFEA